MKFITLATLLLMEMSAFCQTEPKTIREPLEVVKAFLTAYQEHNHQTFSSYLHPDIIWIQPGNNRISGVITSRSELLAMGKTMWELSAGTIKLEDVEYFESQGNTVVAVLHWTAVHPVGTRLDVRNIDVYTVEDGKITVAKIYSQDELSEDRFWGK